MRVDIDEALRKLQEQSDREAIAEDVIYESEAGEVVMTRSTIRVNGVDLSHEGLQKILPTQPRCCETCAFRAGSPERSDPYKWASLVDHFAGGGAFLCHEGIPGHQEQREGEPLRLCAGRHAAEGISIKNLVNMAHLTPYEEAR